MNPVRWLSRKVNTFLSTWKSVGATATLVYAADKTLRTLRAGRAHCYLFVCQPIKPISDKRLLGKNLICREVAASDFDLLPGSPQVVENRRRQNAKVIAAFLDERLIGTLWYTIGSYIEDEVRAMYLPLPAERAAWDFGVEIDPRYRMGRTFITLWSAAMNSMQSNGCKYSFSRINAVNEPSVRSHARLGAISIAYANFIILGRLQVSWSSVSPHFHISWSEKSRPLYRLKAPHDS